MSPCCSGLDSKLAQRIQPLLPLLLLRLQLLLMLVEPAAHGSSLLGPQVQGLVLLALGQRVKWARAGKIVSQCQGYRDTTGAATSPRACCPEHDRAHCATADHQSPQQVLQIKWSFAHALGDRSPGRTMVHPHMHKLLSGGVLKGKPSARSALGQGGPATWSLSDTTQYNSLSRAPSQLQDTQGEGYCAEPHFWCLGLGTRIGHSKDTVAKVLLPGHHLCLPSGPD